MHPIKRIQQLKQERETVSTELSVTFRSNSLVVNGLKALNLNMYDYVEVSFGEMKSVFYVCGKDLISNKVQLEETGYWASKIGYSIDKQSKCDFLNINYQKIEDTERIKQIRTTSAYT